MRPRDHIPRMIVWAFDYRRHLRREKDREFVSKFYWKLRRYGPRLWMSAAQQDYVEDLLRKLPRRAGEDMKHPIDDEVDEMVRKWTFPVLLAGLCRHLHRKQATNQTFKKLNAVYEWMTEPTKEKRIPTKW